MSQKIMFSCIIAFLALSASRVSASSVMTFEGTYENETVSLTVSNPNIYPTPGKGEPSHHLYFTLNPIEDEVQTNRAAVYYNGKWHRFNGNNEIHISLEDEAGEFEFIFFYEVGKPDTRERNQIPIGLRTNHGDIIPNPFGTTEITVEETDSWEGSVNRLMNDYLNSLN